jgi:hypothetical protein
MLATWWQSVIDLIMQLGWFGGGLILILAFFHPTLEAPTAILLLTILSILVGSPWIATALLLVAFIGGFSFFYWLAHHLHRLSGFWLHRFQLSLKAMLWIKAQPTWKHILIIGMPLLYTYPLRVAFTLNHKTFFPYFWQTLGQYLVLSIGNLLIYFGILEIIFLQLPWWIVTIILFLIATMIYLIKSKPIIT